MSTIASATSMTPNGAHPQGWITALLHRVRAEYEEMPGLCLTRAQAMRLWGLDGVACEAILAALVDVGYLRMTSRGYVRA